MILDVQFSESSQSFAPQFGEFQTIHGKDGENGKDGYTPVKGVDYYTPEEKEELINEATEAATMSSYINKDIRIIDTGLTYSRGIIEIRKIGEILWILDSGVYNFTNSFKTAKNRTVLEFDLPKSISEKIPNVNGVYGTTGTISYFPALAYENVTYTTFNCQSYVKRSNIGETEDTYQVVYTGLSAINGGGLCGFHLRMPILLT